MLRIVDDLSNLSEVARQSLAEVRTISDSMQRLSVHASRLKELSEVIDKLASVHSSLSSLLQVSKNEYTALVNKIEDEIDNNTKGLVLPYRSKRKCNVVHPRGLSLIAPRVEKKVVKLSERVSIPAVPVADFDNVLPDGQLYYVNKSRHFAFMLNGFLFHGGIGTVYVDERAPKKVKDCIHGTHCRDTNICSYYHDPTEVKTSTDVRNFISSSWVYSPPRSRPWQRYKARCFGSAENLDFDIVDITKEEVVRFTDQATHDVLCTLALLTCAPTGKTG